MAKPEAAKPKLGRPSSYTDELAEEVCYRVATGRSIADVCDDEDMPDRKTIWRWQETFPDFRLRLTRAREMSIEVEIDDIRHLGKRALREKGLDPQMVRIAVDAFDKAARLRMPRRVELTGAHGGPIQTQDLTHFSEQKLAALASVLGADTDAGAGAGGDPAT